MYTRKRKKNRSWTKEEKYEIIRPFFENYIAKDAIAKKHDISYSVIDRWITKYIEGGIDALELSGRGKGNPYAALHTSKSLTEVERLKLENMKLKIENERLKKGYLVKGVGANKEFVFGKEQSMKSSRN